MNLLILGGFTADLLQEAGFIVFENYSPASLDWHQEHLSRESINAGSQHFHRDLERKDLVVALYYPGLETRLNRTAIGDTDTLIEKIVEEMMRDEQFADQLMPPIEFRKGHIRKTIAGSSAINILDAHNRKKHYEMLIRAGACNEDQHHIERIHELVKPYVYHLEYKPGTIVMIDNDGTMHARYFPRVKSPPLDPEHNDSLMRGFYKFKAGRLQHLL